MTRWLLHHWHAFCTVCWFYLKELAFIFSYAAYVRASQRYLHPLRKLTP
jgi:hypothetical protein